LWVSFPDLFLRVRVGNGTPHPPLTRPLLIENIKVLVANDTNVHSPMTCK